MKGFYEEETYETLKSGNCSHCGKYSDILYDVQELCEHCFDEAAEKERELGLR